MQLSTQCRACSTINTLEYVNNFLSTNPLTLILSSQVREFDKEPKSEKIIFSFCVCVCVCGGGGGSCTETKTLCQTVK